MPPRLGRRQWQNSDIALLGQVRRRMVLWYGAVLAAGLLLFGVILYISVSHIVLDPVSSGLRQQARSLGEQMWDPAIAPYGQPCEFQDRGPGSIEQRSLLWACFNSRGQALNGSQFALDLGSGFTSGSIARSAAASGSAQDMVTIRNLHIERYAVAVSGSTGTVAVVLVGQDVSGELKSLHGLLLALLGLGLVMILASMIAGYFLAGRALIPVRAAQKRQQDFIADASHELRTPLTLLRADAEVLLRNRKALPEEDAELLDDVVHEVDHMSGLADSMLQLARLDASPTHIERDIVDLSEVAEAIARRAAARGAEMGLGIQVNAAPGQYVLGDTLLINQAALALVDNALKYNQPGGTVVIEVRPAGDMVAFRVRDNGPGIAGEHIEHLGKRFYRVDKARSRSMGGAGLGLSIVSRIASQHGGKLNVESRPGEGTEVTVTFPRP